MPSENERVSLCPHGRKRVGGRPAYGCDACSLRRRQIAKRALATREQRGTNFAVAVVRGKWPAWMGTSFEWLRRVHSKPDAVFENEWRTRVFVRNGIVCDAQKRGLWIVSAETYTLHRVLELAELKRHGLKWLGGVPIPGSGFDPELVVFAPLEAVDAGEDLKAFDVSPRGRR
jgi:hypothetical protein